MANSFYWDGSTGSCQYGARYAVMTEKPVIAGLTYDTCIYDEAENTYTKKVGAESSALTAEERSAILEVIKTAVVTLPYQEAYVKTVAQNLTEEEKDTVCQNIGLRRVHAQGGDESSGYWIQYEDGEMECWGMKHTLNVLFDAVYGPSMYGGQGIGVPFPVPFKEAPSVTFSCEMHPTEGVVSTPWPRCSQTTNVKTVLYTFLTKKHTVDCYISYRAKGRWK